MPFGRCPSCNSVYHLNVKVPLDEWYKRHWPQCKAGDEVPAHCFNCWTKMHPSINLEEYLESKYGNLQKIDVTQKELIEILTKSGLSKEDANLHTQICTIMGSRIKVNDRMIGIKKGSDHES